jgi:two-component system sensor histidine kinase QseC
LKSWLQPSLARRTVLALLLAFGLAWCALMVESYLTFRSAVNGLHSLATVARALAETLPEGDERLAAGIVRAAESQYNMHRRQAQVPASRDMLFRLDDMQGHTAYAATALQDAPAPTGAGRSTVQLGGQA